MVVYQGKGKKEKIIERITYSFDDKILEMILPLENKSFYMIILMNTILKIIYINDYLIKTNNQYHYSDGSKSILFSKDNPSDSNSKEKIVSAWDINGKQAFLMEEIYLYIL